MGMLYFSSYATKTDKWWEKNETTTTTMMLISKETAEWLGNVIGHVPSVIRSFAPSLLLTLTIQILSQISKRVASLATDLEIHRTVSEQRSSLTIKLVGLQFVNYYGGLIFTGESPRNSHLLSPLTSPPRRVRRLLFSDALKNIRTHAAFFLGDFVALRKNLATALITNQVFGQFTEVGIPLLKAVYKTVRTPSPPDFTLSGRKVTTDNKKTADAAPSVKDAPENLYTESSRELALESYPGVFSDYLEMWLQMGQGGLGEGRSS